MFKSIAPGSSVSAQASYYAGVVLVKLGRFQDAIAQFNEADKDIASLIFSGLTRFGPDGQVLPDMADHWVISPDADLWLVRLVLPADAPRPGL